MRRSALLVLAALALWELYARSGPADALILPAPSQVAQALVVERGLLARNLWTTGGEVVLGVLASLAVGLGLAVALHLVGWLRQAVYPLLVASQTVPIPVVAPVLILWFGFGLLPRVLVIALVCFFPVVVATLDGLARVDPDQLKLARTLDASRGQLLRHVELPAALPALLSGAKVAVAVALIGAVLAEQTGAEAGLGHQLLQDTAQLESARAWAAVVLLSAVALALFAALSLAERRWVAWARTPPRGGSR